MNQMLIRKTSIFLTLILAFILFFFGRLEEKSSVWQTNMSGMDILEYSTMQIEKKEELIEGKIRIQLPDDVNIDNIDIENDYMDHTVYFNIPNTAEDFFDNNPLVGETSGVSDINYSYNEDTDVMTIEMVTDSVYEANIKEDDGYVYLNFVAPDEAYDKIVVIDPGHGGNEPGKDIGNVYEKDINLAIALKLKALLDDTDIKVYYTRLDDNYPSLQERVTLANETGANMFISIHNNANETYLKGTQVLWNEQLEYDGLGTYELAEVMDNNVVSSLKSDNRGLLEGCDAAYIIREAKIPACLIEVGFMTNPGELAKLIDSTYQQNAAEGIYNGIKEAFDMGF